MNLYELNQIGYSQLPNYNQDDFSFALLVIEKWIKEHFASYYMFLCNNQKYYTIYHNSFGKSIAEKARIIIDIAKNLGSIKSIELNESGDGIEFWIIPDGCEDIQMFLLFDYSRGVVEI